MTVKKYNGYKIVLNDSINSLPIARYIDFNRHMMAESEIGSTLSDYDHRLRRAEGFIKRDDKNNALVELSNARATIRNAIKQVSPKLMAFAVLVDEIEARADNNFHFIQMR